MIVCKIGFIYTQSTDLSSDCPSSEEGPSSTLLDLNRNVAVLTVVSVSNVRVIETRTHVHHKMVDVSLVAFCH